LAGVEIRGEAQIAINEKVVEAKDFHFLGSLDAGGGLPDIVELASFRRARVVELIALRVEMRFAEEGRHQRQKQQYDQPGRQDDEAGGKAHDGHDILRLPEYLPHQRHPSAGLAPRPLKLVLEFGILEVFQVELCRVLHQADA
jgi:hypothetical protein